MYFRRHPPKHPQSPAILLLSPTVALTAMLTKMWVINRKQGGGFKDFAKNQVFPGYENRPAAPRLLYRELNHPNPAVNLFSRCACRL
jgi:hypothetical protein